MFGDQKITHRITSLIWFNTWNSPRWGWKSGKPSIKLRFSSLHQIWGEFPEPFCCWTDRFIGCFLSHLKGDVSEQSCSRALRCFKNLGPLKISLSKINESIWILHFYLSLCPTPPHPITNKKKLQKMLNKHSRTNFLLTETFPPPHPGLGSKATNPPQVRHETHLVCPWRCYQRPSTFQSCSACRREDGTLPARFLGWFGVAGWGWLVLLGGWLGGWLVGRVGRLILRSWAFEMHVPSQPKNSKGRL